MAAPRQVVAGGWENLAWMNTDPDLGALRARADFRQLLAELEKTSAADK
jgi:hypothetical protein